VTNDKIQPCLRRIDANCFRANPVWAKQALAYRIVHLLTPKPLTKRLPKGLRTALLAPGVDVPAGVEIPPGTVVSPGAEIPAGWTPADPLPPGAIPPATYPPGVDPSETGPTPPTYTEVWSPGPVATGVGGGYAGFWFYDPFDDLDLTVWAKAVVDSATIEAVDGWMEFYCPGATSIARLRHTHPTAVPDNCDITFQMLCTINTDYIQLIFETATRSIAIRFETTTGVHLWDGVQWVFYDLIDWKDVGWEWVLKVRGGVINVYRTLTHVITNHAFATEMVTPGRLTLLAWHRSTVKFGALKIEEI